MGDDSNPESHAAESPGNSGPLQPLIAAWAASPPAPDFALFVTDQARADRDLLAALIRIDAQHRSQRGETIRLEDYAAAIGPDMMAQGGYLAPGAPLTRTVLTFERLAGACRSEVRARLGPAYSADIDEVFGDPDAEEDIPPTDLYGASTEGVRGGDKGRADFKDYMSRRRPYGFGFEPGTVINGRYRLVKQLDLGSDGRPRGAFGQVWEAQQLIELRSQGAIPPDTGGDRKSTESPKRTTQRLAIKFIRRERADDAVLKRFIEVEPKALARLSHPYVARFHELGFVDGDPYLVMEYVRGGPITEYADVKRLKLDDRIALMVKVCDAVQHVHSNGLLHRDLKPANILVAEMEDGAGRKAIPKIIDFGLAKSSTNEPIASQVYSEVFAGTKPYCSPEQLARYSHESLTHAVDVYGLCAVLFELLVGVGPMHHVLSDERISAVEKDSRCAKDPRPTPLQAYNRLPREEQDRIAAARSTTISGMRRFLGGAMRLLMAAALEIEPERRLQEVSHLREDLERYLKGEPFRHALREPAWSKAARRVRRNPLPYAAAAGVFLALVAGLAATSWQWKRAEAARRGEQKALLAERDARQNAINEADLSNAISDFLVSDLLGAPRPESRGPSVTVREVLDDALTTVPTRFADRPLTEAGIRHALGRAYLALGILNPAVQELTFSFEYFVTSRGSDDTRTVGAAVDLARALWREQRSDDALAVLSRVSESASVPVLFEWAAALKHSGRPEEAAEYYERGYVTIVDSIGPESRGALVASLNIALNEEQRGRTESARTWFETALGGIRSHLAASDPLLAETLAEFARFTSTKLLDKPRAEELYRDAVAQMAASHGEEHWRTAQTRANLGTFLIRAGRCDEAAEFFDAALKYYATDASARARDGGAIVLRRYTEGLLGCGKKEEAARVAHAAWQSSVTARGANDPASEVLKSILDAIIAPAD